ncbi:response regulator transcription factor [Dysgonomonas sp. 520]|uniref:response regulator transcription factor n=1 Tax=Dysgonomonas sp. 520 TaxID=2302931 RepID=UPI0013D6BD18|nr:response regulator transcription factor [Dysgonomonas sp. 520]NDW08773.1 DNA-binding response regulator [Dysgonomonas sp. 520]
MKDLILADNQDISRIGLKTLAVTFDAISSIHVARNKKEIVKYLMNNSESIIILDYVLFDFASANELLIMQQRFPQSRWIIFSEELSNSFIKTLVFSNSSFCIILKSCSTKEIKMAFTAALQNDRYLCNQITDMLVNSKDSLEEFLRAEPLTSTEKDILRSMAQGKTTKEIAYERNSSFHTVTTHRKNIFRKLNVNNLHEATKYAIRAGLIDAADYYI